MFFVSVLHKMVRNENCIFFNNLLKIIRLNVERWYCYSYLTSLHDHYADGMALTMFHGNEAVGLMGMDRHIPTDK